MLTRKNNKKKESNPKTKKKVIIRKFINKIIQIAYDKFKKDFNKN